jgi:hypothetical protein
VLRKFLATTSIALNATLWLPSQLKILRTGHAADYNPWSFGAILYLQVASLLIAKMDKSGQSSFLLWKLSR